ncbi:CorA metal ion transporter [Kickxella alabastrina]|nr:CorA metal ion transporter [Kickxella alabastrina]
MLPTPSENKFRRRNSQSSVRPLSIARGAAGSVHIDWDSSALLEIANHGKISDEEPRIDRYASETRKAIGAYSSTAITRRNMSLSRQHSSSKSNNSALSPSAQHHEGAIPGAFPGDPTLPVSSSKDEFQPSPSSFGCNSPKEGAYLYQDEPLECAANKMGSLAASLLAPSESRFDPNPKSRFVLYSPSAGIFESRNLDGLRSGDLTLADIIEASSKSITLDQLQSNRTSTQGDSHSSQGGPISSCPASGCFWMDVTNPTPEEMASLARVFGIHPLTVEDIMADDDSRDKFETFSGYNFLMYRTIDYGDDAKSTYEFNRGTEGIATASFSIILKHSCVLTFHSARELDHVGNVISRLRDLAPLSTTSLTAIQPVVTPAYIAYALVDDITDTLAPEMRSIELEIDAVDELVLILSTNEQADMLKRIGAARRKILTVWRLLQGKPDVIRSFSKLMERQAVADDMLRVELEDAEYMRRMMDTSAPQAPAYPEGASAAPPANTGLHMSLSSSALALPQTTLRRNTHSSTAIPLLAAGSATGSGAARRKDPPLWQTYITGNLNVKDSQPLSTQPSTVDLPAGAMRGDTMGPVTADEVAHYLSDVYDHLVSLVGSSSHCDMVLSRAHSNYLARISLELGESTVETNLFASRWTVIGAILVPLNVVTGLWGMNVKVPGRDRDDVLDFFMILTGCLVFVAVVIVWARYKKIF